MSSRRRSIHVDSVEWRPLHIPELQRHVFMAVAGDSDLPRREALAGRFQTVSVLGIPSAIYQELRSGGSPTVAIRGSRLNLRGTLPPGDAFGEVPYDGEDWRVLGIGIGRRPLEAALGTWSDEHGLQLARRQRELLRVGPAEVEEADFMVASVARVVYPRWRGLL